MKNYNQSDYALNKSTRNIVYRFADGIVEITPEEYLEQNPGKTKKDYGRLKALSNAIYRRQDRQEYNQTRKNVSLHRLGDVRDASDLLPDEQYIETQDIRYATQVMGELLEGGLLTDKQRRRFHMHIVEGLSLRKIADMEGVTHNAIAQSIREVLRLLDKLYKI